jgi:hypothetical protein
MHVYYGLVKGLRWTATSWLTWRLQRVEGSPAAARLAAQGLAQRGLHDAVRRQLLQVQVGRLGLQRGAGQQRGGLASGQRVGGVDSS